MLHCDMQDTHAALYHSEVTPSLHVPPSLTTSDLQSEKVELLRINFL